MIVCINFLFASLVESYNNQSNIIKLFIIFLLFYNLIDGVDKINESSEYFNEVFKFVFIDEFNENMSNSDCDNLTKIYCLKFLIYFRFQIPKEWLKELLSMIIKICKESECKVIRDAGFLTLEKLLYLKNTTNSTCINVYEDIIKDSHVFTTLLTYLTDLIFGDLTNHLAMKCFFRLIYLMDLNTLLYILTILMEFNNSIFERLYKNQDDSETSTLMRNSSEPFAYYFFEAIAIVFNKLKSHEEAYNCFRDNIIEQTMRIIMKNSNLDEIGYAFQIISLMMYNENKNFFTYIVSKINNVLEHFKSIDEQF